MIIIFCLSQIEQWVQTIDELDTKIKKTRDMILQQKALTTAELDEFTKNILEREKMNIQLIEMRKRK